MWVWGSQGRGMQGLGVFSAEITAPNLQPPWEDGSGAGGAGYLHISDPPPSHSAPRASSYHNQEQLSTKAYPEREFISFYS